MVSRKAWVAPVVTIAALLCGCGQQVADDALRAADRSATQDSYGLEEPMVAQPEAECSAPVDLSTVRTYVQKNESLALSDSVVKSLVNSLDVGSHSLDFAARGVPLAELAKAGVDATSLGDDISSATVILLDGSWSAADVGIVSSADGEDSKLKLSKLFYVLDDDMHVRGFLGGVGNGCLVG